MNSADMNNATRIWHALAANRVDKVAYLPCNKLNAMMRQQPDDIEVWNITKESVGLGLCFGRSLAGKRSAMMIQNTGLGNLITELYTLQKLYQEALPLFVSWRGYYQEPIEAQTIFGSKVEHLLKAIDVEYAIIKCSADLDDIEADIGQCFAQNKVKVYLLSPELWEINSADFHVFGAPRIAPVAVETSGYSGKPPLTRIQAIQVIMDSIDERDMVISQIGFPSKELYNTHDRALNFYMLGALGSATEVGIALATETRDRHLYVIDGDGSLFFTPNQLTDVAVFNPQNLTVICLDNGSWGSTGNQPTHSSKGINLSAMARCTGISDTKMTDHADAFSDALRNKHRFVHQMIRAGNDKGGADIPLKALEIKQRFMQAVRW